MITVAARGARPHLQLCTQQGRQRPYINAPCTRGRARSEGSSRRLRGMAAGARLLLVQGLDLPLPLRLPADGLAALACGQARGPWHSGAAARFARALATLSMCACVGVLGSWRADTRRRHQHRHPSGLQGARGPALTQPPCDINGGTFSDDSNAKIGGRSNKSPHQRARELRRSRSGTARRKLPELAKGSSGAPGPIRWMRRCSP